MIIFLYGPDSYRRNQKLKELVQSYKTKHDQIDLFGVDLEDDSESWIRARDFLSQPSMFVQSKVLVVKESGAVDEKEWSKTLKLELETSKTFVLISDKDRPTKNLSFLLKDPVKYQVFSELQDKELENFLKTEAIKKELVFAQDAFRHLCGFLMSQEERSWILVNEIQKLALLKLPQPIALKGIKQLYRLKNR
ncbi:MAG: hypothetical protein AAB884_01410, partial [Patescibacteria group bacterium]